jgi:hypothetical protein
MPVQENLARQAPLSRSPNTQWSFLNWGEMRAFPGARQLAGAKPRRMGGRVTL